MSRKPLKHVERIEIQYDKEHWNLLKDLRGRAMRTMETLGRFHFHSVAHGSIARGDVTKRSDIDIFVPNPPSSSILETTLERAGISINQRIIVQATPHYAMKAYLEIDEEHHVSFPLLKLRRLERDFYKFGGEASLDMLREYARVPGVDKRLMFIEPTSEGHIESSIVGREESIARFLSISIETVLDRIHALLRRSETGRTGVFIKRELLPEETFEIVLKRLVDQNPAVRRRFKLRDK